MLDHQPPLRAHCIVRDSLFMTSMSEIARTAELPSTVPACNSGSQTPRGSRDRWRQLATAARSGSTTVMGLFIPIVKGVGTSVVWIPQAVAPFADRVFQPALASLPPLVISAISREAPAPLAEFEEIQRTQS